MYSRSRDYDYKTEKYANIGSQHLYALIAVETLGPTITSCRQHFAHMGRKISSTSGDYREGAFLFCGEFLCLCNAVLLHDTYTLPATDCTDWWPNVMTVIYKFVLLLLLNQFNSRKLAAVTW